MDNIINELGICGKNVKPTQKDDTFIAVVPYSWLKKLMKCRKLDYDHKKVYDGSWQVDDNPISPWTKIVIRVFPKRVSKVLPLPRPKLSSGKNDTLSFSQLLSCVSQTNHRNLWKESYKKHSIDYSTQSVKEQSTVTVVDYNTSLNDVIARLYGCNIFKIKVDPADPSSQTSELISGKHASKVYDTHSNMLPVICAIDMEKSLFLIHHFHYSHTLLDCLLFSPVLLELNYSRNLFIIYQLMQLMKSMYNRGVNFGEVKLEDIYLNDNLWIQVSPQIMANLNTVHPDDISEFNKLSPSELSGTSAKNKVWSEYWGSNDSGRDELVSLEKLCDLWVKGCLSNLDYLVHLNILSGRRSGDPLAHHVIPWVTDFSSRCGKQWRDLTKSKYRLTKGDRQLDMTYDILGREFLGVHASPHQIPHHVSDVLSDITYYVYMARRTSKEILCRNVRNNWVPAEYPSSIQRMQEWTPDECIPEFFTDPNVFKSQHEDLPDLEVPAWASCVEDFIMKHREALESVQVSESLHHWIDLTFGYKLSGSAAVKAKNVCLSLVDGHTELSRSGPVQLFGSAHPARLSQNTHCWGEKLPPKIYWQKDRKKANRSNDSSEEFSDDEEEDCNIPQNYSNLNIPVGQKPSTSRRKSSSRTRKPGKKEEDSPHHVIPPSPSHSSISTLDARISSNSSTPRHFKVQKSEYGKLPIHLPKEFNPIGHLLAVENLHNFKVKTFYKHKDNGKSASEMNLEGRTDKPSTTMDSSSSTKEDLSNVYHSDLQCDENSFTNQMFVAAYEKNYLKKLAKENKDSFKEKKDRSFNTRFVANVLLYKQMVLSNRKKDMQVLGCLIIEIFLNQKVRPFQSRAMKSFDERYKVCRLVLKNNLNALPKCVRYVTSLLLQIEEVENPIRGVEEQLDNFLELTASQVNFSSIQKNGLPAPSATQLLQPLLSNQLLPFPPNFPVLYSVVTVLHEYSITERELNILYSFDCDGQDCLKYQYFDKTKLYFTQKIAEAKVHSCSLQMENFFNQISSFNQFDSVNLFLPHFIELLNNKTTSILAAWYLFDPVSKALGPIESSNKLLSLILILYDDHMGDKTGNINARKADSNNMTAYNSKKSVKLYHNIFLLQLIVRFGLQCFLENFVPHLVEAVGGYKDTGVTEPTVHTHPGGQFKSANSIKKLTYCEEPLKTASNVPHDILSPDTSCGSENTLTPCIEKEYNLSPEKPRKQTDSITESDVFHFESDGNRETTSKSDGASEDTKSWETNIFNKSNIKSLIEEIDCISESPNLDRYLNHVQALEATESIYGGDEDESSKSDDPQNKNPDEIYFHENNYGSPTSSPPSRSAKDSAETSKAGPSSPTIAIPNSYRTFTSYVQGPDEDDDTSQEMFHNEGGNSSKSLDINKISSHRRKSLRIMESDKRKEKLNPKRSQQLYLASNNTKDCKISEMSSESLIWLAHRLGPVLTCKYLTRNLLKMLTLCYIGRENLLAVTGEESYANRLDSLCIANSRLVGDSNATKVIECLTSIAALYGEQIILLQYFPHMGDLIASCRRKISGPLEGGLIACLQLLRFLIPYMSDVKLMEQLQDIILKNILHPTVRLISSTRSTFPNGHLARSALAKKFLETLYVLALRIGPEMTRKHLCVPALQRFFLAFDKVHCKSDWKKSDEDQPGTSKMGPPEAEEAHSSVDEGGPYLEICRDGSTAEWRVRGGEVCGGAVRDSSSSPPDKTDPAIMSALEELQTVFDAELAHQSFIPFYKFVGEGTMDRSLKNPDTVRKLCREYDISGPKSPRCNVQHTSPRQLSQISPSDESLSKRALNDSNPVKIGMDVHLGRSDSVPCKSNYNNEETSNSNSFGSNVAIIGNRIDVQSDPIDEDSVKSGFSYIDALDVVSCKMENGLRSSRHLRGDWLMYWEHEIGRPDKDNRFNLKQIKLQTFAGHTHSVRTIVCLDNENSFMSGSKDKTIKLWSLRNQGDGSAVSTCQWTYTGHRKGILSLTFLESSRLAVSTDASVHIWDPYVESIVKQLDNSKSSPVSIVKAMPAPSAVVLAATTDTVLKFIDSRTCSFVHELKVTLNPNTFIRCVCVSPSGRWVAVGLATGHLSLLDPRTGALLSHWKAHDGEILQLVTVNEASIVSTSLDQTMLVWSTVDGKLRFQLKGSTEPVHCLSTYYTELISGTTNNRIGVHTAIDQDASFSSTKLRSDTFKGVLTAMTVLPLNRMLLLGGESGNISLLC